MGILDGKKGLIFGVANDRSIAAGIARACHAQGAQLAFSHLPGDKMLRRCKLAVDELNPLFYAPCDVTQEGQLKEVFEQAKAEMGQIDFLVHSLAFADRNDLINPYHQTSREGFNLALNVSAYSLVEMTRELIAVQPDNPCSIIALTYLGSVMAVQNYNVMGVAKAALESSVRYLALELGPKNIRVNAISAGPVRTLAAMAVGDFQSMLELAEGKSPLKRTVSQDEVGTSAAYLLSDMASGVTGEIHYVDAGYNIVGL